MKKLIVLIFSVIALFILNACDSNEIPDDAVIAVCPQGDTFKYIYKDDIVYEFYSNDVLQDQSMLDIVQNSVDGVGTVRDYLDATFQEGVCTFSTYASPKE